MEAMLKAGLPPGETEAAGLEEEAKAEGRLGTEREGTGGTTSAWEDACVGSGAPSLSDSRTYSQVARAEVG